jgi:hypothetical protein
LPQQKHKESTAKIAKNAKTYFGGVTSFEAVARLEVSFTNLINTPLQRGVNESAARIEVVVYF